MSGSSKSFQACTIANNMRLRVLLIITAHTNVTSTLLISMYWIFFFSHLNLFEPSENFFMIIMIISKYESLYNVVFMLFGMPGKLQ